MMSLNLTVSRTVELCKCTNLQICKSTKVINHYSNRRSVDKFLTINATARQSCIFPLIGLSQSGQLVLKKFFVLEVQLSSSFLIKTRKTAPVGNSDKMQHEI